MRTSVRLMGVAAATASLLALGAPAFADGMGHHRHGGNDNDANILPINACDDNVGLLLGFVIPIGSPQNGDCVAGVNAED